MWLQELEATASAQLREALGENLSLKKELTRLEDRNNQLQGYGLDDTSANELSGLIHSLTQVSIHNLLPVLQCMCRWNAVWHISTWLFT